MAYIGNASRVVPFVPRKRVGMGGVTAAEWFNTPLASSLNRSESFAWDTGRVTNEPVYFDTASKATATPTDDKWLLWGAGALIVLAVLMTLTKRKE